MTIFDEKNKVASPFFSFKKIGDKIEGTLVDVSTVMNTLSGKEQQIYELKCSDGNYAKVGGKPGIDGQMKRVRLGQIVGFEFMSEKENSNPAFSPTKIIQVYADSEVVDKEWLESQESVDKLIDTENSFAPEQVGEEGDGPETSATDLLNDIQMLAIAKLGAKDAEDAKAKTMEKTGKALIEANYAEIKADLEALPDPAPAK